MRAGGPARGCFAALVGTSGAWLLEYAAEADGLRVVQSWNDSGPYDTADDAFAGLRRLIDARGARSAELAVTVNGFGALHHSVMLPSANPEVLAPLVRREVLRSFDLHDPVIRFTTGDPVERRATSRGDTGTESALRMVFIAALPRETAAAIQRHLTDARIHVRCVTVVPESLRHIFVAIGTPRDATAVLVCLASGPYLAFFLNGQPEIIVDPPVALDAESALDPELLRVQVERGEIYFRQRFGGAEPARLLLAAPAKENAAIADLLQSSTGTPVEPLMGDSSPEAIVAMGAVFASRTAGAIDLFERPPRAGERLQAFTRAYGPATVGLGAVALLAALWMVMQLVALSRASSDRTRLQQAVQTAVTSAAPVQGMAQERATHEQQAEALRTIYGERSRLAGTLASVARIAGPGVRFDSVKVDEDKKGWSVTVLGSVLGTPGSYAVRTLNEFYSALRAQPAVVTPDLERFDYGHPAGGAADTGRAAAGSGVALTFVVSFGVSRDAPAAGASKPGQGE